MAIKDMLLKFFSAQDRVVGYSWEEDPHGVIFFTDRQQSKKIAEGKAEMWITQQHIALKMLAEQGIAEPIPKGGFIVPADVVVGLDAGTQEILGLPPQWQGRIAADIRGNSGQSTFVVNIEVEGQHGVMTGGYTITGPLLAFSQSRKYVLTQAQYEIFHGVEIHKQSDKSEYDNLRLLLALQDAQQAGANVDLAHFNKMDIKAPESVTIHADCDPDGNLILTPFMGQQASHDKINRVLGQLRNTSARSLRVGDEIILFDERTLEGIHEILKNRVVPKEKVEQFYKNPTAFIDASLVDLDIGFSVRVQGATKFRHAYFGDTEESGIDWFGAAASATSGSVLPVTKLSQYIQDAEKLTEFKEAYCDAKKAGASELEFAGQVFDVENEGKVQEEIEKMERKLLEGDDTADDKTDVTVDDGDTGESEVNEADEPAVVDIALNDEELGTTSPRLEAAISSVLYPQERLDWSNYLRKPFEHQEIGVRWILGLFCSPQGIDGGLLADDMGLGKTFMALSAIDQIYKVLHERQETQKPCLIVAPLSLLENWKEEVEKTFHHSPFNDIVILQSDAALRRYRVGGVETRQDVRETSENETAEIRYSLKVGKAFLDERLDLPKRLVITTYQTLRDYQFSLCRIDWSMVIFDEAQNIKNPNTIQTRAAKGLKGDFKLLATGTPVENSLAEFWCLMDTACPGFLNTYQDFRRRYIAPILQAAGDEIEEVRGRVGRELRLTVGALMLRRIKEDNLKGLPQKKIFVGVRSQDWEYLPLLDTTMKDRQLEAYNATLSAEISSESNTTLASLQRLQDISLHPQLADGGQLRVMKNNKELAALMGESGKFMSMLSALDEIRRRGEKCIIFAVNKRLQNFLSAVLGRHYGLGPLSVINGDTKAVAKRPSDGTRKSMIQDFEKREGFNIIIMSPVAAGVGLTIVGANNVIHLQRHWNPAKENQATDRVYRIGQQRDVNVYIPVLHHPIHESFDVNLHKLLSSKSKLKDAVVTAEQVHPSPDGFGETFSDPDRRLTEKELARISWRQFEALCAELFAQEFTASRSWLTHSGADYGADVVLLGDSSAQLIQCKHTLGNKRYEGYKAIQEVSGAAKKYEIELQKPVDRLVFATNAKVVSAKSKKLAAEYGVHLRTYSDIAELLRAYPVTYRMVVRRLGMERLKVV